MNSKGNIYIAVIDDDESICCSMGRWLRAAHFLPVTYLSAEDFLTDTNRPKFACLVLDIQLKGMSGLDLGKRLRAVQDFTPIIFITAQDSSEIQAQIEDSRGTVFFRKTDSGAAILAAIRHTINLGAGTKSVTDES